MASKSKIYIILEFVAGGELFDQIVRNICFSFILGLDYTQSMLLIPCGHMYLFLCMFTYV
jgi:hypothetical protein